MSDVKFGADYSKRVSKCQKCKEELPKGNVRLSKITANFYHDGEGEMKNYYHIKCLFETFKRARATTKVIESADEVDGFAQLNETDKESIIESITDLDKNRNKDGKPKAATTPAAKQDKPTKAAAKRDDGSDDEVIEVTKKSKPTTASNDDDDNTEDDTTDNADNKFDAFVKLCDRMAAKSGGAKTQVLKDFIEKGTNGNGFKGDLALLIKFLLPNSSNRVYNLNSVSLVKLYSRLFGEDSDEMAKHLNQGDVANTIKVFFEKSKRLKPQKTSTLTLKRVDKFLDKLTKFRTETEQLGILKEIAGVCTSDDLHMIIRLIKKDLRINAGEKVVLDGVAENAYNAYKVSRDLDDVVTRLLKSPMKKDLSIKINLMKPIKPMLADACKSCETAIKKCPAGAYVEIKYDGERLQVHKNGNDFSYFSRNLKPVPSHKVDHLKEFIPKAFPYAHDLILDGEVLLYCTKTKKPLPFGTLGVHKKANFKDALVCFFVFDIVYMNGKDLMGETLKERRKILEKTVKEIPGRIMLSDQQLITKADKLRDIMMQAIRDGLEGLVIKDANSKYEPGKRHWLKMKKDYLDEGKMADTADLVVLGAYYGTGNKGGMKSVFLMGVYNEKAQKWQTVTKCGNGFDDKTLDKLQDELDMVEINKDYSKVPDWLDVNRSLVPDFIMRNPKKAPVWEITGAEFSNSDSHTAGGISIRFPRVTRVRDDKSWKEATNLDRLKELFKVSKEKTDLDMDEVRRIESETEEDVVVPKGLSKKSPKKRTLAEKNDDDDDDDSGKSKKKSKTQPAATAKTPLPAIFSKVRIYLSPNIENLDKLKRYIIAYDGEVLNDYEIDDATHICDTKDKPIKNSNKKTVHVGVDDLWKCIKMRTKLSD